MRECLFEAVTDTRGLNFALPSVFAPSILRCRVHHCEIIVSDGRCIAGVIECIEARLTNIESHIHGEGQTRPEADGDAPLDEEEKADAAQAAATQAGPRRRPQPGDYDRQPATNQR
jgi:hypothetical protein